MSVSCWEFRSPPLSRKEREIAEDKLSMIDSTPPSNKPNKGDSDVNETLLQPSTISTLSYYSPREIKPLPNPHIPMGTRKRRIQKSEVLTSTPVKEEQKIKFDKASTKVLQNFNRDTKTKPTLKKVLARPKMLKRPKILKLLKILGRNLNISKILKNTHATFVEKTILKSMGNHLMIGSNVFPVSNGVTKNVRPLKERIRLLATIALITD
ncbi:hypothetical protein ACJJTC_001460 [Scirpophaga incertulas]